MKAVLALLLGVAYSTPLWQQELTLSEFKTLESESLQSFQEWANVFERTYADDEFTDRYLQWVDNLYTIADYNSQDFSFKLRMNQFGDMSHDEFIQYVHGDSGSCLKANDNSTFVIGGDDHDYVAHEESSSSSSSEELDLASSVDWTTKGVVTPVKNQGNCGSCWAFSTTGALECEYAIKHGTLNSLSEQQLVDCAPRTDGCAGCNGGSMDGAFSYVKSSGGLCSEKEYSYTAKDGTCKSSSCGTKYNANTGYKDVSADSYSSLTSAVNSGCVSVAIEADQTAFQYYSSGVLTGSCGTNLDHGVLVVGYGTSGSNQYWKVKNSWGSSWGENGYILICKECGKNGSKGECGILMQPSYPTF